MQISAEALDNAIACVRAVRVAVSSRVNLLIERHGRFDIPTAVRIARKPEPFHPMFFEEPVPPDSLDSLRAVKDKAPVPIAAGERLYVGTTAACLTE